MNDTVNCPVCAKPLKRDDICASDIEMGPCHAECLEGSPVVDLESGQELPDGKLHTYPFSVISDPPPPSTQPLPRPTFPILNGNGVRIDYQLVADHGGQAQRNHYQSVERLAQRGGLSWCELHAVLHDRAYQKMDQNTAIIECRALEARYLAALVTPSPQPNVVPEGWRLVPAELTDEMISAHLPLGSSEGTKSYIREIWGNLLSAAPPSPPRRA